MDASENVKEGYNLRERGVLMGNNIKMKLK
jgi:hypothetical protein